MLFGVTKITNQISDYESAAASGLLSEADKLINISSLLSNVETGQSLGLLMCMTVLPCALMLISNAMYQKKYTLDEAEYERILKELEKR